MRRALPLPSRVLLAAAVLAVILLPGEGRGARERGAEPPPARPPSVAIAVLDIAGPDSGLKRSHLESITDWVRDAAQRSVPNANVFTRENVQQLLEDNDQELARCVGDCEVETGRLLGADYIVTGVVTKFAATYVLTLKIHDTHSGRFLGAEKARAEAVDGLVDGVDRASRRLFGRVPEARTAGQSERGGATPAAVPPPPPPPASGGGRRPADELAPIAAEEGMLRVEGAPKGARVDLAGPEAFGADGAVATTLPYGPARVPAGTYRVKVSAPDHDAQRREVRVYADRTEVVRVALEKSWGRLETTGTPAGARVELRCGEDFEKTFGLGSALTVPRGACRIVVSRDGYERFEETVAVKGGETVRVEVKLAEVAAALRTSRGPDGAPGRAGIDWVRLDGGTFRMGSTEGDDDERPVHRVRVPTFAIARTETTVSQWKACVSDGPCSEPDTGTYCNWGRRDRGAHPVNCVDWEQARTFCEWAGGRLCSEAEWEYAARSGGRDRTYPWGDADATCARAVMDDRRTRGGAGDETDGCGEDRTWPVCSKRSGDSAQGVCDLAGNVWEWVEDDYHRSYRGAPSDGSAWVERPRASIRVFAAAAGATARPTCGPPIAAAAARRSASATWACAAAGRGLRPPGPLFPCSPVAPRSGARSVPPRSGVGGAAAEGSERGRTSFRARVRERNGAVAPGGFSKGGGPPLDRARRPGAKEPGWREGD